MTTLLPHSTRITITNIKNPIMLSCPHRYDSYDITTKNCPICGQGKLYQTDRLDEGKQACAGWVHPKHGPLSCESYIETYKNHQKDNLVIK